MWWYSEFSLFRNSQLEELSSRTSVHVGTLDSAHLLPGEGRDSPFRKWLRRAVLPLNAEMIQEGARQTNSFCATNSKCGPAPSVLIKLIKLMGITLPPQDEPKLSRVDEVKHNHVLEQLSLPPSVQAIWPNICSGHGAGGSRSNSEEERGPPQPPG